MRSWGLVDTSAFVRRAKRRLATAQLILNQFETLAASGEQYESKADDLEDLWLTFAEQLETVGQKLRALVEHKVIRDKEFVERLELRCKPGQLLCFLRESRNLEQHDNVDVVERLQKNWSYISTGLWVQFEHHSIVLRPLSLIKKGRPVELTAEFHGEDKIEQPSPADIARRAIDWYTEMVETADNLMVCGQPESVGAGDRAG